MNEMPNFIKQTDLAKRLYAPTRHDTALAAKLCQSDVNAMQARLPDLGVSLHSAAIDLAKDCTIPRIDEMLARLKCVGTSLLHLRRAEIEEVRAGRD